MRIRMCVGCAWMHDDDDIHHSNARIPTGHGATLAWEPNPIQDPPADGRTSPDRSELTRVCKSGSDINHERVRTSPE